MGVLARDQQTAKLGSAQGECNQGAPQPARHAIQYVPGEKKPGTGPGLESLGEDA
jgi:hypothetical protein